MHKKSMSLELAARSALNLSGRGGLYGTIDADYIDKVGNAFTVLVASLSPYYKDGSAETVQKISSFLEKYYHLGDKELEKEEYFVGVEESAKELRSLLKEIRNY
ncbi:hypothetical protein [Oceanobacillus alkalisoli]|uniref:hypothetical protein n=1 Tax=Oceanobacillus alkalisoli TaxID=2925113 RepID=UPI001F11C604|nr:hypothetical protein [Oceanobacillus alkalisoli]MCF3942222.1 hypothetical protein [Oceanobacillus alkalisoli]